MTLPFFVLLYSPDIAVVQVHAKDLQMKNHRQRCVRFHQSQVFQNVKKATFSNRSQ